VVRVEQYLKAYPATPLSRHRPEEVRAYLEEIGRKGGLEDWQFRQIVDALDALFCKVVVAPWAARFDWGHWKDSARSLTCDMSRRPLCQHNAPCVLPLDRSRRIRYKF
jgi:hypothetical protein